MRIRRYILILPKKPRGKIHKLVQFFTENHFLCYAKAIIIYAVGGTLLLVFIGVTIYCCRRKSTSTNTSQASIVARRSTKNSSSDRVVLETGHNAISDADVWNPKVGRIIGTVFFAGPLYIVQNDRQPNMIS